MPIFKIFPLLLILFDLHAGIDFYFKNAPGKNRPFQLRNIDFIYMINLDQRPQKFAKCLDQFSFYGIEPYRFSAVNGWELSPEAINDLGICFQPWMSMEKWGTYYEEDLEARHEPVQVYGKTYFSHCMSRGAIGILLSHLSVLQDAYDSGYQTIWVMEDDIEILQNPEILPDLIDRLDALVGETGWDVLFTDVDTKGQDGQYVPSFGFAWRPNYSPDNPGSYSHRVVISADFKKIGSRFGAYSMIVRRSGIEKILNFFKEFKIFLPYDIDFVLPQGIRLYSLNYDVVSTEPKAASDNSSPNYLR